MACGIRENTLETNSREEILTNKPRVISEQIISVWNARAPNFRIQLMIVGGFSRFTRIGRIGLRAMKPLPRDAPFFK